MGTDALTFDEATHTYRVNGRVVPNVTRILQRVYPDVYAGIPAHILERKAALGRAVHRAIELELAGQLEWETLHPEVLPYVRCWNNWRVDRDLTMFASEERLYSMSGGYAMTRDFRGMLGSRYTLIDWKITSHHLPTHDLQLTGYASANAEFFDSVGCLYLNNSGEPAEFREVDHVRCLPDWLATLRVFNRQERMK